MKLLITSLCVAGIMAMFPTTPQVPHALRVPAFTAYIEPNPDGAKVSEEAGITGWSDRKQSVSWFGSIAKPGKLAVSLSVQLPAGETSRLRFIVNKTKLIAEARGAANGAPVRVDFGTVEIPHPG